MKMLLALILVGCAVQLSAFAQGTMQFRIEFPGAPAPPAIGIPSGGAELSNSSFHGWFFLGASAASSGRIVEMADSSFTPVFEFGGVIVYSHPPMPGIPGSGGTYYSYDETWQVTESQVQALLSGRWYAEIAFGPEVHLAQFVPVPEPSTVSLFLLGIAWFGVWERNRRTSRCIE